MTAGASGCRGRTDTGSAEGGIPSWDADVMDFTFQAELWRWGAREADGWTFVSLPAEASDVIRDVASATPRRGFGSVRVTATVGDTTWATSIFPDAAQDSYVLPMKKAVREAEALSTGDVVTVTVELVAF